jgi:hypothetical protein
MDENNVMKSEFKVNKIEKVEKMDVDDIDSRESNKRQKGNIEAENENCEPRQGKDSNKSSEFVFQLIDTLLTRVVGFEVGLATTGQHTKGNTFFQTFINNLKGYAVIQTSPAFLFWSPSTTGY